MLSGIYGLIAGKAEQPTQQPPTNNDRTGRLGGEEVRQVSGDPRAFVLGRGAFGASVESGYQHYALGVDDGEGTQLRIVGMGSSPHSEKASSYPLKVPVQATPDQVAKMEKSMVKNVEDNLKLSSPWRALRYTGENCQDMTRRVIEENGAKFPEEAAKKSGFVDRSFTQSPMAQARNARLDQHIQESILNGSFSG